MPLYNITNDPQPPPHPQLQAQEDATQSTHHKLNTVEPLFIVKLPHTSMIKAHHPAPQAQASHQEAQPHPQPHQADIYILLLFCIYIISGYILTQPAHHPVVVPLAQHHAPPPHAVVSDQPVFQAHNPPAPLLVD